MAAPGGGSEPGLTQGNHQPIKKNKQKREIMNIFFSFRVWRLLLSFNASFNTDND